MSRRKKTDIGPLGTMIDLAGGIALGLLTRQEIKNAYKEGRGLEAVRAATMVYGAGGMRKKGNHLLEIGGLYGIQSEVEAARKEQQRAREGTNAVFVESVFVEP